MEKAGASIINETPIEKVNLAYRIKKLNQAFFLNFEFKLDQASVPNLFNELGLKSEVIRFILNKVELESENKSKRKAARNVDTIRGKTSPQNQKDSTRGSNQVLTNEALEEKIQEILN